MTDLHYLSPEDDAEALAAEYVLGVLPLTDRIAAETRIKSDTVFADSVARWETHFAELNGAFEAAPAPDLMPIIEARIFGKPTLAKRSWWGMFAGAGIAAALAVAVFVNLRPSGLTTLENNGPVLSASLAADNQDLAFNASYADGTLTLARLAGKSAVSGKDYELWVIVGDAAPVSLGLIKDATSTRPVDALAPGSVLAVSLENAGGSTTGAPDQVLLTGIIVSS